MSIKLRKAAILTFAWLSVPVPRAAAQVTIDRASPRWGESITITAEPTPAASAAQRFERSDRLYAVLGTYEKGTSPRTGRRWTPMSWDGRRFVARLTLPHGCEAGYVVVATAEQAFFPSARYFVCSMPDGRLPPGALISGLTWGRRDRSNWKADVADDLTALRATDDPGWAHAVIWLLRRSHERDAFTRQEFLRDVERVDREEARRTAGLLASLVYGYDGAGETAKAFERLKELCDRFPEAEFTPRLGLYFATAALVSHPDFQSEFQRLFAQVAQRAPENKGFRDFFKLSTGTPDLPLSTIRQLTTSWIRDDPAEMMPHYMLAVALSSSSGQEAEAEAQATTAIELLLRPHPYDSAESRVRQQAFALRSRLRAAREDLVGALADARMAQLVARDKAGADDLSVEAELWQRLGYGRKAEELATDAYRLGSLTAEALLRKIYVARTGGDAGFRDYLIGRLRERDASSTPALRPTPAFLATTLDGVKVDKSMLRDRVTVLYFWFINCPPCRVERPKLNEIVAEFGDQVRFVGFALDRADRLKTYVAGNPLKYEVVPESQEIATAFAVQSYPTHMVVDRTGKIVWLSGSGDDRVERLRAMIYRVLASQAAR